MSDQPKARTGSIWRIKPRYDNGGAPFVRVVTARPLVVQDYSHDGELFRQQWGYAHPRRMDRQKLTTCWTLTPEPSMEITRLKGATS